MWEKMQCSVSEVVSKSKASTVPLQIETWSRFISSLMTPDLYIQLGTAALRGGTKILTMACVKMLVFSNNNIDHLSLLFAG